MPIQGLAKALTARLGDLEQSGRLKGRESVVTGFTSSREDRGPRFTIDGEGDNLFLRMNSNSYLGMSRQVNGYRARKILCQRVESLFLQADGDCTKVLPV